MTNWKRINELDRKVIKKFKIVIVFTLLAFVLSLVFLLSLKDEYGYLALLIFVNGYVLALIFKRYDKEFLEIADKIDKLK